MTIKLTYDKFFAYSDKSNKYFFTEFGRNINIVYGRNTSGKSTLFLSILYTFGINDGNHYLKELLDEGLIFRIDCTIARNGQEENLIIIRDDDTLFIKIANAPLKRFNGISANNSAEHVKLKHFINELFEFTLHLESKNEYKPAPIETIFLPYYISQTVGWVYLRKSFSSLDFYKNFKEDYLDYYLGLDPEVDRVKRHEIEKKLRAVQSQISLISKFETNNEDIQLTKLSDEQFVETSNSYIKTYAENYTTLTEQENDYVIKCNELGFLQERKSILQKVSNNQKTQNPETANCPTCTQSLPFGIPEVYEHLQGLNDTIHELAIVKAKIKDVQSKINSLQKSINEGRETISKEYVILNKYINNGVSFDKWLKNKANTELISNLNERLGQLTVDQKETQGQLEKYKTEEEIEKARNTQSNTFTALFSSYLVELGVKKLEEERYLKLYQISAFPSQGVELHKTIMAYHFAFNNLISGTDNIHRMPFMLDAIFKEDLDEGNKQTILRFINKCKPSDTQTIISIAQKKGQLNNVDSYNTNYFSNNAKLISIGNGETERAFLTEYKDQQLQLLTETLDIINGELN